jgi:hypothetical protein
MQLEDVPDTTHYPPISELSDLVGLTAEEVLRLADAKMEEAQNQRLGYLQAKGKAQGLNEAESMDGVVDLVPLPRFSFMV